MRSTQIGCDVIIALHPLQEAGGGHRLCQRSVQGFLSPALRAGGWWRTGTESSIFYTHAYERDAVHFNASVCAAVLRPLARTPLACSALVMPTWFQLTVPQWILCHGPCSHPHPDCWCRLQQLYRRPLVTARESVARYARILCC